jgi:serine/threonine protein phosphatase PrpC
MTKFSFGGGTNVGRKRLNNEDSYKVDLSMGLWLIADGMGGAKGGGVASKTAIEVVVHNINNGMSLSESILTAHQSIVYESSKNVELNGMGTTIVALKCGHSTDYEIAWVGDSRAYLWDRTLSLLTHDHSYVQRLVDEGELEAKNAWCHPQSNVITQALGMINKNISVDNIHGQWLENQKILLCSDGLHGELRDNEIEALINNNESNQEIADNLIKAALERGGKDNISVFIISSSIDKNKLEDTSDVTVPFSSEFQLTAPKHSIQSAEKPSGFSKSYIVLLTLITLILFVSVLFMLQSSLFVPP